MALPQSIAAFNSILNIVEPEQGGAWSDYDTWATAQNWNPGAGPIEWVSEPLFLPPGACAIEITAEAAGEVSYEVWVSPSGEFDDDETIVYIEPGDQNIAAFQGQIAYIVAKVTNSTGLAQLFDLQVRATNQSRFISINGIDTSTLAGSVTARTLDLGRPISGVTNIQITPKSTANYTMAVFSTDFPTSNVVIPVVVDKTVPSIRLVGLDNVPRDAVVDIVAEALPEQYMSGNNLLLR